MVGMLQTYGKIAHKRPRIFWGEMSTKHWCSWDVHMPSKKKFGWCCQRICVCITIIYSNSASSCGKPYFDSKYFVIQMAWQSFLPSNWILLHCSARVVTSVVFGLRISINIKGQKFQYVVELLTMNCIWNFDPVRHRFLGYCETAPYGHLHSYRVNEVAIISLQNWITAQIPTNLTEDIAFRTTAVCRNFHDNKMPKSVWEIREN